MKKIFYVIFALILVFSAMSSCASQKAENTENKSDDTPKQADESATEPATEGKLPFEPVIIDLGGRAFTFVDCDWGAETSARQRDVFVEEENGETINDAVFARNRVIIDMFNCTIAEQKYPGPGEMQSGFKKIINSGEQYDAAYIRYSSHLSPFATG
ncbi:MAG: hypothetical protein FWD23_04060, partial [Oscillospiraceae bacterium]|nr:hypothetical protein [Oscillospiraceae bacterium]